jgi:hypothetical protein
MKNYTWTWLDVNEGPCDTVKVSVATTNLAGAHKPICWPKHVDTGIPIVDV